MKKTMATYLLLKTLALLVALCFQEQGTLHKKHAQKTYSGKKIQNMIFFLANLYISKFAVLDSCFIIHFRSSVAQRHFDSKNAY